MRALTVVIGILVATVAPGASALAQNYPWCAVYSTGDGAMLGYCQRHRRTL